MPRTAVTLESADGSARPGEADVRVHSSSSRTLKATALVIAGFVGGGACLIVPGLHLVTTWGLPLLGIVLGLRAYRTRASLDAGQGTYPACGEPVELVPIKVGVEPVSMSCPGCGAPFAIRLPEASDDEVS